MSRPIRRGLGSLLASIAISAPVCPRYLRSGCLAAKYRELVAEYEDLEVLVYVGSCQQNEPTQHPRRQQVHQLEPHQPNHAPAWLAANMQVTALRREMGTHTHTGQVDCPDFCTCGGGGAACAIVGGEQSGFRGYECSSPAGAWVTTSSVLRLLHTCGTTSPAATPITSPEPHAAPSPHPTG